ncbi:hypothetical protein HK101_008564 [Irineochytrium annulatum]|nr:hypothetical protein HK101_008564 [Irineochytrium annulatum]
MNMTVPLPAPTSDQVSTAPGVDLWPAATIPTIPTSRSSSAGSVSSDSTLAPATREDRDRTMRQIEFLLGTTTTAAADLKLIDATSPVCDIDLERRLRASNDVLAAAITDARALIHTHHSALSNLASSRGELRAETGRLLDVLSALQDEESAIRALRVQAEDEVARMCVELVAAREAVSEVEKGLRKEEGALKVVRGEFGRVREELKVVEGAKAGEKNSGGRARSRPAPPPPPPSRGRGRAKATTGSATTEKLTTEEVLKKEMPEAEAAKEGEITSAAAVEEVPAVETVLAMKMDVPEVQDRIMLEFECPRIIVELASETPVEKTTSEIAILGTPTEPAKIDTTDVPSPAALDATPSNTTAPPPMPPMETKPRRGTPLCEHKDANVTCAMVVDIVPVALELAVSMELDDAESIAVAAML